MMDSAMNFYLAFLRNLKKDLLALLVFENAKDITLKDWETTYEKLFGGFIDLNNEDSYSEEEEIPEHMKTKSGYSKEGGFIVDDDEVEERSELPGAPAGTEADPKTKEETQTKSEQARPE